MSQASSFEFKEFIPKELYRRYFDVAAKGGKLFVCVIQDEAQVNTIYLERPRESDGPNVEGIARVFFDVGHVKRYCSQIAMVENLHPDTVKRWEVQFDELIEYILTFDERRRAAGRKSIAAIASAFYGEKFVQIDTVWTSNKEVMV
jgi:hypothetical protein